jgi:hypothetical protein
MDIALPMRAAATDEHAGQVVAPSSAERYEPVSSRAALEQARDRLLARLHARPDDFAATQELQGVGDKLATLRSDADHDRPRRLRRSGLSFFDGLRARWHRRNSRRGASR